MHWTLFCSLLALTQVSLAADATELPPCDYIDNGRCSEWGEDFCRSAQFTVDQKREMCGKMCGLCDSKNHECEGDKNPTCIEWAANGFCASEQFTKQARRYFCCQSCADELAKTPDTNCGAVYAEEREIINIEDPQSGAGVRVNAARTSAGSVITSTKAFVSVGCKMIVYKSASTTSVTLKGTGQFVTLRQPVHSAKCTCA